jgi:hypothetical protein
MILIASVPQRQAVHVLHDQEGHVAGFAEFQRTDDVGVVDPVGGPELLLETLDEDGVGGHVRRHDLDGDDLTGRTVPAAVDRAHAALGDLFQKVVIANGLQRRHGATDSHCEVPRLSPAPALPGVRWRRREPDDALAIWRGALRPRHAMGILETTVVAVACLGEERSTTPRGEAGKVGKLPWRGVRLFATIE